MILFSYKEYFIKRYVLSMPLSRSKQSLDDKQSSSDKVYKSPDRKREESPSGKKSSRSRDKEECTVKSHLELKRELEEAQEELIKSDKEYNETVQQLIDQEEILKNPEAYRRMFQKEFGQDIFEVLKKDIIVYLKGIGEWPTVSTRSSSPSRSSMNPIKPFTGRVQRIASQRLTPS
jgi:hypothetical protein